MRPVLGCKEVAGNIMCYAHNRVAPLLPSLKGVIPALRHTCHLPVVVMQACLPRICQKVDQLPGTTPERSATFLQLQRHLGTTSIRSVTR
jgi:hypothetical protein